MHAKTLNNWMSGYSYGPGFSFGKPFGKPFGRPFGRRDVDEDEVTTVTEKGKEEITTTSDEWGNTQRVTEIDTPFKHEEITTTGDEWGNTQRVTEIDTAFGHEEIVQSTNGSY
jgi:hypothetical protein